MGIIKDSLVVLLLWPMLAMSCPESFMERLASKAFYETREVQDGELEGIHIGWSKERLIAHLRAHNILTVGVIDDAPFFATKKCLSELSKVSATEDIYIANSNMKILGKVSLVNGAVQSVALNDEASLAIVTGMPRQEVLASLRKFLVDTPDRAIYSKPNCSPNCALSLDGLSQENLISLQGLEFLSLDGKGKVRAYFKGDALTRLTYVSQKYKGDGVF